MISIYLRLWVEQMKKYHCALERNLNNRTLLEIAEIIPIFAFNFTSELLVYYDYNEL